MNKIKKTGAVLLLAALAAAVLVGLYQGGWWLREDGVNRTSRINNDSYARQEALADEIIDLHTQVADLEVTAAGDVTAEQKTLILTQRTALVRNLCASYDQSTGTTTLPTDIHSFAAQEC
jgi:hypothetical protein